jgi:dihydrofolate reductase
MIDGIKINIIVATTLSGVIGKDGKLPWSIPEDLRRFNELTMGKLVIMGRKTYESLPEPKLPGRHIYVISRSLIDEHISNGTSDTVPSNVDVVESAIDVFQHIKFLKITDENPLEPYDIDNNGIYVCGGEKIYEEFLPHTDTIYMTEIDVELSGDTFFPIHKLSDVFGCVRTYEVGGGYIPYKFKVLQRLLDTPVMYFCSYKISPKGNPEQIYVDGHMLYESRSRGVDLISGLIDKINQDEFDFDAKYDATNYSVVLTAFNKI